MCSPPLNNRKQKKFEHKMTSPAKWPKCAYDYMYIALTQQIMTFELHSTYYFLFSPPKKLVH